MEYKECPFCGSKDIGYLFGCSQGVMACQNCGAEGPKADDAADPVCSIEAAEEAWNTRHVHPAPSEPTE